MKGGKHSNGQFVTSVYRYDPVAREMTCDFGGATNVYRYGADGKLLAVSIPGEGWATYSYNALGQNDAVTLPGGTRRSLAYDAFGRLASQSAVDGGGNALLAQAYGRSLTGRLETKTTDVGTWRYGYDLTDQVTNAVLSASASSDGAWGYAYDAMGNRKQASVSSGNSTPDVTAYIANNLNQYSAITNSAFSASPREIRPTYDLNGNMIWDGTNAYFWDLQNQLVLVSNATVQVASAYDAMGRRVRKTVSRRDAETQSWAVEETRHFFYDGRNVIAEIGSRSSEVSTNRYVWGNDLSGSLQGAGGVGGLLAVSTLPTAYCQLPIVSYPFYDHNGNVERYAARNGVTVASYQYDAFGKTVSASGSMADAFAYRFSTKYWDAETGLVMFQLRPYSPEQGRWISRDCLEDESVALNLYSMCGNRVVNDADYLGMYSIGAGYGAIGLPHFDGPIVVPPSISDHIRGNNTFNNTSWFDLNYQGWVSHARQYYQNTINSWVKGHCGSSPYPGPSFRFNIYPYENETRYGDPPQSFFSADKVLGSFAIDIETPVNIEYDGVQYQWTTTMYVEDILGLQEYDPIYNRLTAWLFPSRRVRRATWEISGSGDCCNP